MTDARSALAATEDRSTEALLEVDGLTVDLLTEFGWATVVEDVSFAVSAGQTVGIVGESGSGKTVTSMAVMGLLPTSSARVAAAGGVRLGGDDLLGLTQSEMEDVRGARVAMIFQEPMTSLNPAFTVGDQIAETIRRHRGVSRRVAKRQAAEMLTRVHIPDAARRADSYPHEFSGGMRQRVMIAMALSCDPSLLIADEPTTALDVTVQAQVLELIKEIQDDMGMGILLVTHDLGVVADVCDDVVVMYAGQVVESAPVVELFHRPAHPYTDGLLASMPVIAARSGRLSSIGGQPPLLGSFPSGCRFSPRCVHAIDTCRAGSSGSTPLTAPTVDRAVRCLRSEELILQGVQR